jgi:outer membrane protein TolC
MRSAPLLLTLSLVCASLPAGALTFEDALRLAGERPSVTAPTRAATARSPHDVSPGGRVGNPESLLGMGPGSTAPNFGGPGFELQATLTVPIALHDVGGDRRRSVDAERAALAAEQRRRLFEHRREAARAWLTLASAQSLLTVVRAEAASARELADGLARAVAQGAAVSADALEATLAAEDVAARALQAEGDVAEAAAALAAATGVAPLPPPTADGEAPAVTLPASDAWPAWIALAHSLPTAQAHTWTAPAARLLAAEADGAGGSSITVGAQAQRNSSEQWQLYALIGARWSAFDRNQRARAHALEAAHLAEGEAATAGERARVVMALAFHDVAHAREVEAHQRDATLPAADRLVAARELALRHAAGTVFELLRARAARLRAVAELSAAEGDRRRAELDAWLLVSSLQRAGSSR